MTELELRACDMRIDIVRMIAEAGSGHPGGSLSCTDILTALYFGGVMDHDPEDPKWEGRDRFILAKGHAAPALYAALAHAGYFPREELNTLRKLGTRLQGHPDCNLCPGVEVSTGSLGQGLSIAAGAAAGLKLAGKPQRVFCLLGDGECEEGQVWEAAMWAAHEGLDNLVAIVDRNHLQIDGDTADVCDPGDMVREVRRVRLERQHRSTATTSMRLSLRSPLRRRAADGRPHVSGGEHHQGQAACRSWKTRPVGTARPPTPSRPSRPWPSSRPRSKEA